MTKAGLQVVGLLAVPGFLAVANADEGSFPAVGSRVRVRVSGSGSLVGTLSAAGDASLTVTRPGEEAGSVVARRDVTRLERSVRPSQKSRGALIGLAVGFGAGFAAAAALGNCSEVPGVVDHCAAAAPSAIYGAIAGAAGAGIGALVAPGERWAEVPLGREHRAGPDATRVSLRVRPLAGAVRGALVSVSW